MPNPKFPQYDESEHIDSAATAQPDEEETNYTDEYLEPLHKKDGLR